MKFGVIVFPGSNCDHDSYDAIQQVTGQQVTFLWHDWQDLQSCDAVILPGGFAYGDYLRTGAIAKFASIMGPLRQFASNGGLVLGICNGFQILCEAGLLPGALLRNAGLKYICKQTYVRVETNDTPFTDTCKQYDVLRIPIGHMEGNYFCSAETLSQLKDQGRIVFRYCTSSGEITPESNPNGSIDNIAGICNESRNLLGMMPHPDRCSEGMLGSADGIKIFASMVEALQPSSL